MDPGSWWPAFIRMIQTSKRDEVVDLELPGRLSLQD
jgi:hypothetical protein